MGGDLVWLVKSPSLSSSSKLEARWTGPLRISERMGEHTYMLIDKKGVSSMAHVDQMKEYKCLRQLNELAGLGCWDREMVRVTDTTIT